MKNVLIPHAESLGSKTREILPAYFRIPFIVFLLLLCGYQIYTYSGIYALLANLQIALFGQYMIVATSAFTFLITIFGGMILVVGLAKVLGKDSDTNRKAISQSLSEKPIVKKKLATVISPRFPAHPIVIILSLLPGVAFVIVGLYFFIPVLLFHLDQNQMQSFSMNNLSVKNLQQQQYVELNDVFMDEDAALSMGQKINTTTVSYFYVPVYPEKLGFPIEDTFTPVYFEVRDYLLKGDLLPEFQKSREQKSFKGMLYKNHLPGLIRDDFIKNNTLDNSQDHFVLVLGETVEKINQGGLLFMQLGGFFLLLSPLFMFGLDKYIRIHGGF